MRLSSITELSAATLALLAIPVTARPYITSMDSCLLEVAADTPCVSALGFQYLLWVSQEDLDLFGSALARSKCTVDKAIDTTRAVKVCLDARDAAASNQADPGPDDLRRRDIDTDQHPQRPVQARGTKLARATNDFNVTVASLIVGIALGLTAFVSAVVVCFCCIRESSRKKAARAAADAKAAEKEAARAARKANAGK